MARNPEETMMDRLRELKADTDLEFMKEFLESAPKQVQEDYVLLSQSVREGNSANRAFHAHKLKGLLLTIGADAAAAISLTIEEFTGGNNDAALQEMLSGLDVEVNTVLRTLDRIAPRLLHEQ